MGYKAGMTHIVREVERPGSSKLIRGFLCFMGAGFKCARNGVAATHLLSTSILDSSQGSHGVYLETAAPYISWIELSFAPRCRLPYS